MEKRRCEMTQEERRHYDKLKLREWRFKNKEKTKQYNINAKHYRAEWNKKHPRQNNERVRRWRKENRQYYKLYNSIEENAFKMQIRQKLNRAKYKGLIQQQNCEICGSGQSEAHHINYEDVFCVKWLCRQHHRKEHLKIKIKKTYAKLHSRPDTGNQN